MGEKAGQLKGLAVECVCLYLSWLTIVPIVDLALGGPSALAANVSGAIAMAITVVYVSRRDRGVWRWGRTPRPWISLAMCLMGLALGRGAAGWTNAAAVSPLLIQPAESVALEVVITGPIRLEMFWRGLVLKRLTKIIGFWPALAISSLLLGLTHFSMAIGVFPAAFVGVVLGLLYSPLTFIGTGYLAMNMVVLILFNLSARLPLPSGM